VFAQALGSVHIAWNANDPNIDPDLAGYRIYVDDDPNTFNLAPSAAKPLSRTIDVGSSVTDQIVTSLDPNKVFTFAVTALDLSGNESGFSNRVSQQPSILPIVRSVAPASATQGDPNVPVTISGANFLSTSTVSFGTGITVGAPTLGPSGTLLVTVTVNSIAQAKSYDVTVTNPGGSAGTKAGAFTVDVNLGRLDIDGSNRIDGADFLDILLGFPSMAGDAYYNTTRDLDVDGGIDGADLAIFFSCFGAARAGPMQPFICP